MSRPPQFTGRMWRRPDGRLQAILTDVFDESVHLIGHKEGDEYHLRGWRGNRLSLIEPEGVYKKRGRPARSTPPPTTALVAEVVAAPVEDGEETDDE